MDRNVVEKEEQGETRESTVREQTKGITLLCIYQSATEARGDPASSSSP
jgi:hypothetical protein